MSIVRFEPFKDLISMQDKMNRLFEDSFLRSMDGEEVVAQGTWSPVVDIYEKKDSIVLKAEVPGLEKDDISVVVEENVLTIKGEKKQENDVEKDRLHRVERTYGSFERSFTLPKTVDQEKLEAEYRNGVLVITLPKVPEAKPKQIEVSVH
jgi:HSP20 family protein